jgi:hypothetical protein
MLRCCKTLRTMLISTGVSVPKGKHRFLGNPLCLSLQHDRFKM